MIRSGSICLTFLYKYLMSENEISTNENGGDILKKKGTKLKCLSDTFQSYGGVLAKLSQIISFEHKDSSVFSDCQPFSKDKTIEFLKNEYKTNPEFFKYIKEIDFEPYKSGSVGQVHKATYFNKKQNKDEKIIIKTQYVGLEEQIQTDLFILDKLVNYLYSSSDLSNAMVDIKTKLYEELDYTLEFNNQKRIYDIWKENKNIKIAKLIPSICNNKFLAMKYIEGESLNDFINNSTQEQRNKIGMSIVKFVFKNLYKEGIFYSDIHYGNFLVKDKSILYVMDFGCIHYIEPELLSNLKKIHISIINQDIEQFYHIITELGIINENISKESKEYIYEYFKLQLEPYISEEFEFTEKWLDKAVYKNIDLMKEWSLPSNMVYLNKIPYGMSHVLVKIGLKGKFLSFFTEILK